MKAILDHDLVSGLGFGDFDGPPVPAALSGLPPERLRYVGTGLVDAATLSSFYVDDQGRKHAVDAPGRQLVSCAWNSLLIQDGGVWRTLTLPESLAPEIKAECARRIFAVASANTQMNLTAAAAADRMLPEDANIYDDALTWVDDMRAACASLIAAGEASYRDDGHWPPVPAGVAELAGRY